MTFVGRPQPASVAFGHCRRGPHHERHRVDTPSSPRPCSRPLVDDHRRIDLVDHSATSSSGTASFTSRLPSVADTSTGGESSRQPRAPPPLTTPCTISCRCRCSTPASSQIPLEVVRSRTSFRTSTAQLLYARTAPVLDRERKGPTRRLVPFATPTGFDTTRRRRSRHLAAPTAPPNDLDQPVPSAT